MELSCNSKVLILMATFNGVAHIHGQIESILAQTCPDFELWIRDDGSTDETVDVVRFFAASDHRIRIIEDSCYGGSAGENFSILMQYACEHATSPYIAFADQDDIWKENKLDELLKRMQECEEQYGKETACLVFSDMRVVNSDKTIINGSFWAMEQIAPERDTRIYALMSRNVAPGCSMVINRSLLQKATPIPDAALMHDWWLLLIARIYGEIAFVEYPCMDYVQHANNQIGAKQRAFGNALVLLLKSPVTQYKKVRRLHNRVIAQSAALLQMDLPEQQRSKINRYLRIRSSGIVTRLLNVDVFLSSSPVVCLANIVIT